MSEMETFGSVIRKARQEMKFSMETVAKKLGVTRAYINIIEKDKCGVSLENIGKLAEILHLNIGNLIELQDKRQGETTPEWLKYIANKYSPSEYVIGTMKKLIVSSGLEWETKGARFDEKWAMREKWEAFYGLVKKMLDDFNLKVFSDDRVRASLRKLGLTEECGWQAIKDAVEKEIFGLAILPDEEDYKRWRSNVASSLYIKELKLNGSTMNDLMLKALSSGAAKDTIAGMTIIASSGNLYSAVYKAGEYESACTKYCYIEDAEGKKARMKDFPFWHEVARVVLDPELKFGRGMKKDEERYEFDAFEYLLSRVAAWIALMPIRESMHFPRVELYNKAVELEEKVLPFEYAMMGLLDKDPNPIIYAMCQMREKTDCPEESTCLRAAKTFRNIAASRLKADVRYNMAVSEQGIIKTAYDKRASYTSRNTRLSLEWNRRYRLDGEIKLLSAIYDETECAVHAFMDMKEE